MPRKGSGYARYELMMLNLAISMTHSVTRWNAMKEVPSNDPLYVVYKEVFLPFGDICTCLENLDIALKYIGATRPKNGPAIGAEYLAYHVSFFLQEIYILSERLEGYAKSVFRLNKRRGNNPSKEMQEATIALLRELFGDLVATRGSHVHDRPFTTRSLHTLARYGLIARVQPDQRMYREGLSEFYIETKRELLKRFRADRKRIKKNLETFFDYMHHEVTQGHKPLVVTDNSGIKRRRAR